MDRRGQRAKAQAEPSEPSAGFVLYVEGPRDREILSTWARRSWPEVARAIERSSVILGGRQPARAESHFREQHAAGKASRGLCVLDRDSETSARAGYEPPGKLPPGLDFFVWPRRHIESYLLDRTPIERCLRGRLEDPRTAQALRTMLPEPESEGFEDLDAKRLLSRRGPIAELLDFELRPSHIARAMLPGELHQDVAGLFERIRNGMGLRSGGPEVVIRNSANGR